MKYGRLVILLITLSLSVVPCFSDVTISGDTSVSTTILPVINYSQDRFDSLLNPNNIMELHDVSFSSEFIGKVSGSGGSFSDEAGNYSFDFWFSVEPIGIPNLLMAIAAGDTSMSYAVSQLLGYSDYSFYGLKLLRADINWSMGDLFNITVGRQPIFVGYGYGWSPMNFLGGLKNPLSFGEISPGIDAITLEYDAGNTLTLDISALYKPYNYATGIDYSAVEGFAKLVLSLPHVEISLDGLYAYDSDSSATTSVVADTTRVPAVGGGVMLDLGGVGLYTEGAVFKRSRIEYPDASGGLVVKEGVRFDGLVGLQYTFPWDMNAILEYYYNGEGFNLTEREAYKDILNMYGSTYLPADVALLMRPGYFSKNYILLYLMQPFYNINSEFSVSALFSPDSLGLSLIPGINYELSDSVTVNFMYMGFFSLDEGRYSEAYFLPAKHIVWVSFKYSF